MMPGVASTNAAATENAAIFTFMTCLQEIPTCPAVLRAAVIVGSSYREVKSSAARPLSLFQRIELPFQRLVVRIELDRLLEILDLVLLVVLLPVRLRHGGIRRRVVR